MPTVYKERLRLKRHGASDGVMLPVGARPTKAAMMKPDQEFDLTLKYEGGVWQLTAKQVVESEA